MKMMQKMGKALYIFINNSNKAKFLKESSIIIGKMDYFKFNILMDQKLN